MTGERLTLPGVVAELAQYGIELRSEPGTYSVRFRHAPAADTYRTEDLADARTKGLDMALSAAPPEPPRMYDGRRRRRAFIRRHNAKVAAKLSKARRKAFDDTTRRAIELADYRD
jgi:hypothetical protein